jgi:parallel beta-helix repeat protein
MPHCFKLARRLSRLRPVLAHPSPRAHTLPLRLQLIAVTLLGIGIIGCTQDEQLTTGPEATIENPDSTAADSTADSTTVIVTDSVGDGIDSSLAAANTGTTIYPGQSIQAKVNAYPGGTTFTLKAGIHRQQSIAPKTGNVFIGESGAVLSGARLLTAFTRQGGYWVASGQTQQGERRGVGNCAPAYPRCPYPEQLFINNVLLKHVSSLGAVGPGSWYFDYTADKIYFVDDPRGKKVETSVTPRAFDSYASNVTIRGLIIEKYANPAGRGVIGHVAAGPGWVVEDNVIRWNFGVGIKTNTNLRARRNKILSQGHMGISGSGDDVLVEDNELAWNNTAGFTMGWEAGATKFVRTNRLIVRGNFSHHNHGPGLWTDIDNINTLYENNRVEDNDWRGIFHEVSYKATIRNNICRRNGFKLPTDRAISPADGAGILISNSPNVEIYGNTLEGNKNGIMGLETTRATGKYGATDIKYLYVHDNTVTQPTGRAAGLVQNIGSNAIYTSQNNRYAENVYDIGTGTRYKWMNKDVTAAQWRAYGQDVTGSFQ